MLGIRHPFTGALYERDGEGNILVTDGDRTGRFTSEGQWLDGDLREWVAGPQALNHRMADSDRSD